MPTIIADAGPIISLLDAADESHAWAVRVIIPLPRPWITCSAALAEATHHFGNTSRAIRALHEFAPDLVVSDPAAPSVLSLMLKYAPQMDYADACAVLLSRAHPGSVVITTDHRDFSTYRVPFISPKGRFL